MANITIAVDREALKRARIRAIEEGTSVNAILSEFLASYAGLSREREEATEAILTVSHSARSASRGRRWTREELHER
ncbi:MAG: hypothetical protein WD314_02430 [Trueperaceae bacterium]